MPILILLLIAILIAQIGFWDTLSAVLGAVAMVVLLGLVVAALAALGLWLVVRRVRGGLRR